MSGRECAWRSRCPEVVRCRQLRALYGPPLYLVRETGPLGLVVREEGRLKPLLVRLGGRHTCSCRQHRSHHDLCLHLCWVLLRRFRLKPSDPLSFQLGLVPREISALLRGWQRKPVQPCLVDAAVHSLLLPLLAPRNDLTDKSWPGGQAVMLRPVTQGDSCAICLETLLEKRLPVTHCRYSCGNPVHIRCMQVWMQHHNNSDLTADPVKCPLCRGVFNSREALAEEVRNAPRSSSHRTTATKTVDGRRLLSRRPQYGQPPVQASDDLTVARLIEDTSALLEEHCLRVTAGVIGDGGGSGVAQSREASSSSQHSSEASLIKPVAVVVLVRGLPAWRVPPRHRLLLPGRQCCLCLAPYQAGHVVSGLPCGHEFHAACLRPWLLRAAATAAAADDTNTLNRTRGCRCPLDGADLIPWLTERLLNKQKTLSSTAGGSESCGKRVGHAVPHFEVSSTKVTLMSRRLACSGSSSSSSGSRSTTPSPSHLTPSPRAHTGMLPARRLISPSRPSSGFARSSTSQSSVRQVPSPSLHLLTLALPETEGYVTAQVSSSPAPSRSLKLHHLAVVRRGQQAPSAAPIMDHQHATPSFDCLGRQVQLLQRIKPLKL